jgi:hypothetical protein
MHIIPNAPNLEGILMKLRSWAVGVALLIVVCTPGFAGPFGFERGMTKDQIIALVGQNAVEKESKDFGGMQINLWVTTAPAPQKEFRKYLLTLSSTAGLLKIVAVGEMLDTSADPQLLLEHYNDQKSLLTQAYGTPTADVDSLRPGSTLNEPSEFMIGLLKKDRRLQAFWVHEKASAYKDHVTGVQLQPFAYSATNGVVDLVYEFEGFDTFRDSLDTAHN